MSYEIETAEPIKFQCRHIFTDGHRCASPTLRSPSGHEPFCYYHHTTRRPAARTKRDSPSTGSSRKSTFTLPLPGDLSDRSGIQLAIGQVLQMIAANEIDSRRAGLLLYGLQIASLNLKKDRNTEDTDETETVTEITHDPDHGLLAPPAELHANQPIGSAQRFLMELGDVDDLDNIPEPRDIPEPALTEPQPTAAPGNLLIDLQACAVSTGLEHAPMRPNRTMHQLQRSGQGTRCFISRFERARLVALGFSPGSPCRKSSRETGAFSS